MENSEKLLRAGSQCQIPLRTTTMYKAWVGRLAKKKEMSRAALIKAALDLYAEKEGFATYRTDTEV